MRRTIVVVCVIVVFAAGCAEQQLGRKVPECDLSRVDASTTVILMAQSVPGTDFLPCVVALLPGWDFEDVRARSDQSFFTLDSDRMGDDFLRVTLLPSCEVGAATTADTDESGTELSIEVLEERSELVVVILPVAERHQAYAAIVAALMNGNTVKGRFVAAGIDDSLSSASERIASAHKAGRPVVIVDDSDVATATISLRLPGEDEQSSLSTTEALNEIEDDADDPLYRARWFYTFPGGCVRYDFDAEGEGAQSVDRDVAAAIGMYPMEELRELAREAGYRGFE